MKLSMTGERCKPKILLADDEPSMIRYVSQILIGGGYEVAAVDSGAAAIERARSLCPDVALLAVVMPAINGVEAAIEISMLSPDTKIVLLTVLPEETLEGLKTRLRTQGLDFETFNAPFTESELLAKMLEWAGLGFRRDKETQAVNRASPKFAAFETLKGAGFWVLGFGVLLILAAIGVGLVLGMVWISAKLYPIVQFLSWLGAIALVLNLLPSAIFKSSRHYCGRGIVIVSYVWGGALWMYATLALYQVWGLGGMILGFMLLGVGSVPLACVAALFKGAWSVLGEMMLSVAVVFATRALGNWIYSKGEVRPAEYLE